MRPIGLIRVALLGAWLFLLATGSHAACTCVDRPSIDARIEEIQTALRAYRRELGIMQRQFQQGEQLPYTPERREKLQGRVQEALNKLAERKQYPPTNATGGTSNICRTEINPDVSECLRPGVELHEGVHREQCLKTFDPLAVAETVATGHDRFERDRAQLTDYVREEQQAYTAEIEYLKAQRKIARDDCSRKPAPEPESGGRDYTAQ